MSAKAEARAGTLRLTVAATGAVLGLSSAAVLPLLLPWTQKWKLVLLAMLLAGLPFAGLRLAGRRREFERRAAAGSGPVAALIVLSAGLAVLPLFTLYRGQVRVLNHGDDPFALWVDAKRVARVEPSSGESAFSGVELTVPAGLRDLRVVSEVDGRELFRQRALVEGGSQHLFAPLSSAYCFSIERQGYGEAHEAPLASQPLSGANPFWKVPEGIRWFSPNPDPGPLRTSGGTLSSLRQRRCERRESGAATDAPLPPGG